MRALGLLASLAWIAASAAQADDRTPPTTPPPISSILMQLEAQSPVIPGQPVQVILTLTHIADNSPVTFDALSEKHTSKLHLLLIDPTLTEYHHLHPVEAGKPGEYRFRFTPAKARQFRVWADLFPTALDRQEYAVADLGGIQAIKPAPQRTLSLKSRVRDLTLSLSFDTPPQIGKASRGVLRVTDKNGRPFSGLEPVMGAYAHIVGFDETLGGVAHVHPMGPEPQRREDRGGSELAFHLEPHRAGFMKLFAQIRVGNEDLFAPFGVMVKR